MISAVCAVLVILVLGGKSQAADAISTTDPVPPEVQIINGTVLKKLDFNNNTLGEMVLKLNSMIHDEAKGPKVPMVLINFKGMTEPEIAECLRSKIVNMEPLEDVPVSDAVAYLCQIGNCEYRRSGLALILTPYKPYRERLFDVKMMRTHGGR